MVSVDDGEPRERHEGYGVEESLEVLYVPPPDEAEAAADKRWHDAMHYMYEEKLKREKREREERRGSKR